METFINKYTLSFKDEQLELLYQSQTVFSKLKPLYYFSLYAILIMNFVQLLVRIISKGFVSYFNISFILFSVINIVILFKKQKLSQFQIALENSLISLLQLNFLDQSVNMQQSYGVGGMIASLQTALSFVIDFKFSCPSVIIQIITRFAITTYYCQNYDYVLLMLTSIAFGFLTIVLYICNRAQRLQFLMTIKDDNINRQLKNLISQPFAKIHYNEEKMLINIKISSLLNKLVGYSSQFCDACNLRSFLRNGYHECLSLEQGIIKNMIPLNQSIIVKINKQKVQIRVCQFNIENSFIIIQEKIFDNRRKKIELPIKFKEALFSYYSKFQKSRESVLFNTGVISILMMNNTQIKTINLNKLFKKLANIYECLRRINYQWYHNNVVKITTYSYLLKIFMMQIFNIISDIEVDSSNSLKDIEIFVFDICIVLKLKLKTSHQFLHSYNSNFFIKQVQDLLMMSPVNEELEFYFLKKIPFKEICE